MVAFPTARRKKMNEYEKLENWQKNFIDYVANPLETRTLGQFCIDNEIADITLYRFRTSRQDLIYRCADQLRQKFLAGMREKAFKALAKRLDKSDVALKLALQVTGDLVERSESKVEYMSPDEKRQRIEALLAKIKPQ